MLLHGITANVDGSIGWLGQIVLDLVVGADDTGLERCRFERTNVRLTSITALLTIWVSSIATVTHSATMEELLPVLVHA